MGSLSQNDVYVIHPGRCFDEDDTSLADDVVATGYNMLAFGSSSPLKRFNQVLATLQQRRRVKPLIGPGSEQQAPAGSSRVHRGVGEGERIRGYFICFTDSWVAPLLFF